MIVKLFLIIKTLKMKKHYFKLTLSICLLIFVLNCENRQDDKPITLIKENYQAFADVYSQNEATLTAHLNIE